MKQITIAFENVILYEDKSAEVYKKPIILDNPKIKINTA